MATIRELITRYAFKADTAEVQRFDRAIGNVKKAARAAGKAILKVGVGVAGMAAGVGKLVTSVADSSDKIAKTARRLQVPARFLQELRHAAELSGAEMGEVTTSLKRISAAAFDASRGSKETAEAFQAIGVEVKDAGGGLKSVEQLTLETFEGLAKMEDATKRAAIAQKLFGRAGQSMLPMLTGGVAGVRDMMNEANRLGIVLDDKALKSAEDFNDSLTRMRAVVGGVAAKIATSVMPVVEQVVEAVQAWVDENRELLSQITSGAIAALGMALKGIGAALKFVAENWKVVAGLLAAFVAVKVITGIVVLTKAITGIGYAMIGVGKAAVGMKAATTAALAAPGGAAALLKGALLKVGAAGAALGVGWVIGSKLDEWLGLSDKLSGALLGINKRFAKLRVERHGKGVRAERLKETAQRLQELRRRGVESVESKPGGPRIKLDREGIAKLLRAQAGRIGVSGQQQAKLIPALVDQMAQAPARAPAAAPAPAGSTKNVQVAPTTINVTVPPGTAPTQAKRVADAAGAATTAAMRRAIGDVAR